MFHRRPIGIGVASIAALVAVLVGGASPAPAATVKPKITIRYEASGDYLSGWVRSPSDGCNVVRYPFRVFREQPGKDELFQKFGTYDDGYWRAEGPTPKGTYYAKLKKYEYDNVICTKARSPKVTVPG